ncbi:kinase-like domain-containing protein [Mycotypha africana]|uniref:kinase-like domain-containing protein n=1 Tax=Mycotypha africana TaxID=64632 RepID=UPI002301375D|nr:kinase-like domain-containing protein [Mycotypha africana]KAI8984039.1 kinase-like domain-containing protein [Mycotypha africana]
MKKSLGAQIVLPSQKPSVIPIVNPSTSTSVNDGDEDGFEKTTAAKSKSKTKVSTTKGNTNAVGTNNKRLCRNVIIHGYCKFEGKGCEFNHDSRRIINVGAFSIKSKLKSSATASVPLASIVNAPEFIPRSTTATALSANLSNTKTTTAKQNGTGADMTAITNGFSQFGITNDNQQIAASMQPPPPPQMMMLSHSSASGVNPYYYMDQMPVFPRRPLQHHLYSQPPPTHLSRLQPHQRTIHSFFIPDSLREYLTQRNEAQFLTASAHELGLPSEVHVYHSLYPLEPNAAPASAAATNIAASSVPPISQLPKQQSQQQKQETEQRTKDEDSNTDPSSTNILSPSLSASLTTTISPTSTEPISYFYGYPSSVYKAINSLDGRQYAMVRIEGFRLVNEQAMKIVEGWRCIRHCNIVSLRESFTTRAFEGPSLIFIYDYHPCSITLHSVYFSTSSPPSQQPKQHAITEDTIWSFITQIASAIKAIHGRGLAARNIDPKKILITGKNRIRMMGAGILDVLEYEKLTAHGNINANIAIQQQEDLLSFGKLIVALASQSYDSISTEQNLVQSLEFMSRAYSPDLKNVVLYLLSKPLPTKTIDEVVVLTMPRILHEIDNNQFYNDELEYHLSRELENGRLVRLLAKMGFINERPEFDMDPSWSETGDRYLIKLFRDYVFHQVDENGRPVVDIVHVLTCLNKLDAGVEEKIMLTSRDEQSCLIVSYKEIKNCIITAFNDLTSGRK